MTDPLKDLLERELDRRAAAKVPWWRRLLPWPIGWGARDWRSMFALLGSILGSGLLCALAAWIVHILWKGGWPVETAEKRLHALAWALWGALAIVGIILVSLGVAINQRIVKGSFGPASFEVSGGGDDPAPGATVTTTTTVSAPPPVQEHEGDQP